MAAFRNLLDPPARRGPQVKRTLQQRDESFKPLAGRTMAMIFTKPSMRTRISFETVRHPRGPPAKAPVSPPASELCACRILPILIAC